MLTRMAVKVPTYDQMLWPTLQAVISLGGSASIEELDAAVIDAEGYPPGVQEVLHGDGPTTEIKYRLAWTRTYLKGMGVLTNSKRGVWSVTELGRKTREGEISSLHEKFKRGQRERRLRKQEEARRSAAEWSPDVQDSAVEQSATELDWQEALLDILTKMSPSAFENLAKRILRESGFSSVMVTGSSHDGGIDGMGVLQVSLLSFPVYFQCKRYKGSVPSSAVRDFRGAMSGRGEKGLLITTGTFTKSARDEAQRDGAPPIDLIDGGRLCELLKENELGVSTTQRVVEDVTVDSGFFASLEPVPR